MRLTHDGKNDGDFRMRRSVVLTTFDLAIDGRTEDVASGAGMYTAGGQLVGMSAARIQMDVGLYTGNRKPLEKLEQEI